MKFSTF